MTAGLVTWLNDALDDDEAAAHAEEKWRAAHPPVPGVSYELPPLMAHGWDDPARVLAEVTAKRAVIDEVARWQHDYVRDDDWYSCAQAVDSQAGAPGSGCGDDARAGTGCDCGLEHRRARVLGPLAQVYRDRPGFDPSWTS